MYERERERENRKLQTTGIESKREEVGTGITEHLIQKAVLESWHALRDSPG